MKLATVLSPSIPPPTSTVLTWEQSWRFFLLGILRAILLSSLPLVVWLWNWIANWDNPIEWSEFWKLAAATAGPTAALYWKNHWHLLKLPRVLIIPVEFGDPPPRSKFQIPDPSILTPIADPIPDPPTVG